MAARFRPLWVAGAVLLAAANARAATPTEALRDFFARANVLIQAPDEDMTLEQRVAAIRQLASDVFDVRRAAAEALGKEWAARTPAEQEEFVRLFGDVLQRGYLAMVGSKAKVNGGVDVAFVDETLKGDAAIVHSTLRTRTNGELAIVYRLTRRAGQWTVLDATVDGVSLVANYRAQFTRVLQSYSYDDLVDMMRAVAPESLHPPALLVLASEAVKPGDGVKIVAAPFDTAQQPQALPAAPGGDVGAAPAPSSSAAALPPPAEANPAPAATPAAPEAASAATRPAPEAPSAPAAAPAPDAVVAPPAAPPNGVAPPESGPPPTTIARAAPPTETPIPRVDASFWVQIGAFRSPEMAAKLLAKLNQPAIAVFTPGGGREAEPITRVLVGPFPDRAAAVVKAQELEAAGYTTYVRRGTE